MQNSNTTLLLLGKVLPEGVLKTVWVMENWRESVNWQKTKHSLKFKVACSEDSISSKIS